MWIFQAMNNLRKLFLITSLFLASISVVYILICQNIFRNLENQYYKAFNDYSMLPNNQRIVNSVKLGNRQKKPFWGLNYIIEDASLHLVCTNKNNVLLVIKDDINNLTIIDGMFFSASFRIENGVKKGTAKIRHYDVVNSDYLDTEIDTLVSNALSKREINSIVSVLKDRIPNPYPFIGIGFDNTSTGFADLANVPEVEALIKKCK